MQTIAGDHKNFPVGHLFPLEENGSNVCILNEFKGTIYLTEN